MSETISPVAVVIVTWNAAGYLPGCLKSLHDLSRVPEEIVVVDNKSTDGTTDAIRRDFPGVRLIENSENQGFCRANNEGIRATRSPYVLVLNPDTSLRPEFIENLLPAFDDPKVGIATGKLLRFDGTTLDSAGQQLSRSRQPKDRGFGKRDRGQFDRDEEVFGACGAAALYRRSMLESIADPDGVYFDERFFAFFEDLDLAWRARRAGWKSVYRHRAVGLHARGGSIDTPGGRAGLRHRGPEIRFHIAKNRYLSILRNESVAGYLINFPFILARDLATLALLSVTSPQVLGRLWRERAIFADGIRARKLDAVPHGHHVQGGR